MAMRADIGPVEPVVRRIDPEVAGMGRPVGAPAPFRSTAIPPATPDGKLTTPVAASMRGPRARRAVGRNFDREIVAASQAGFRAAGVVRLIEMRCGIRRCRFVESDADVARATLARAARGEKACVEFRRKVLVESLAVPMPRPVRSCRLRIVRPISFHALPSKSSRAFSRQHTAAIPRAVSRRTSRHCRRRRARRHGPRKPPSAEMPNKHAHSFGRRRRRRDDIPRRDGLPARARRARPAPRYA